MLITPTGIPAAGLSDDKIVEMDLDGRFDGAWRPSSEWMMHAEIYKAFPKAEAVVHTHSDHCVALSCLRENIPPFHYMLASFGGDDVRCAEYAPFGSAELARSAVASLRDRSACLLANHGAICFADSLPAAMAKALKLETLSRQFCLARSLGAPVLLRETEMRDVQQRYAAYGQQKTTTC
jgi:L-fuculose-phosphate aldolase